MTTLELIIRVAAWHGLASMRDWWLTVWELWAEESQICLYKIWFMRLPLKRTFQAKTNCISYDHSWMFLIYLNYYSFDGTNFDNKAILAWFVYTRRHNSNYNLPFLCQHLRNVRNGSSIESLSKLRKNLDYFD